MPRVRLFLLPVLYLLLVMCWIERVSADCWYNSKRYEEGSEVTTQEPCLNCTCKKGTPICYLRVCPRLPNAPPRGCILLHKYKACCPELICEDRPSFRSAIEARSDPNDFDVFDTTLERACVANGSIYSPGSAMDSSRFCEYCYCLRGQQHCIKPKCLLAIEGCEPKYSSHSCCPIHYNCTYSIAPTSTTTSSPKTMQDSVKCLVSGKYYQEGEKILGVGHSPCDNCYCIRGLIRCEPLSCAPPLLGCLPVIRLGECCASSYNCSGTIETRPEPNYGNFPIVSKEYAKLRKEVQKTDTNKQIQNSTTNKLKNSEAYYIIAKTPSTLTFKSHRLPSFSGTTRHFTDNRNLNASTPKPPYFTNSTQNTSFNITEQTMTSNQSETVYKDKSNLLYETENHSFEVHNTTSDKYENNTQKRLVSISHKPFHHQSVNSISTGNKEYVKDVTAMVGEAFEEKVDNNKTDGNITNADIALTEFVENEDLEPAYLNFTDNENNEINTTFLFSNSTRQLKNKTHPEYIKNKNEDFQSVELHSDTTELTISTDYFVTETIDVTSSIIDFTTTELVTQQEIVTLKEVVNSTDCIKENKILDLKNVTEMNSDEKLLLNNTSSLNSSDDITIVDLESKVKVSTATLLPLQKFSSDILGVSKVKDSYFDYDFQPTLPPSLPNLRIIPFLPSDALDSEKKQSENKIDYQLVSPVTESTIYSFTSLFSPPVETEGGFVPKEPPLMNNFEQFNENATYAVVNELNAVTSLSGMSITNQGKLDTEVCMSDNKEFRHNDPVPSTNVCRFCVCYFGEIVCQEPPCPLSNLDCHTISNILERLRCCQQIECGKESTTIVLKQNTVTPGPEDLITIAEDVNLPDPFRDEPAPNLQSLISNVKPYFLKKTTANSQQEQTTNFTTARPVADVGHNSFDENLNRSKLKEEELELISSNHSQEMLVSFKKENSTSMLSTIIPNIYDQNSSNKTDVHENKTNDIIKSTNNELSPGVGLLKLAGCNIYGRMYRVGKIIFELSGPCLECKCTEIGVQCTPIC